MADPGLTNGVSEVVGVSQPTVSRAVKEVVEKNCSKSAVWIHFPANRREVEGLVTSWIIKRKLPGFFVLLMGH